jgi:Zn finger protein HypA/HybF involved in hydrogenase expression
MSAGSSGRCPYCDGLISPKPTRKRRCPHCGQTLFVRGGEALTEFAAHVHDEELANLPEEKIERPRGPGVAIGRWCPHCDAPVTFVYDVRGARFTCRECANSVFRIGAELLDAAGFAQWKVERAAISEMRRAAAARELRALQDPDVVGTFPLISIRTSKDAWCCQECAARDGEIIPTRTCTIQTLPPFAACQNLERGCQCIFLSVTKWEAEKLFG